MRVVAVAATLVVAFFSGLASCQMAMPMDCALPTDIDIEAVLRVIIEVGDSASTPDINVIDFTPRCLAVSEQRDRYRATCISILVDYTCTGNVLAMSRRRQGRGANRS